MTDKKDAVPDFSMTEAQLKAYWDWYYEDVSNQISRIGKYAERKRAPTV